MTTQDATTAGLGPLAAMIAGSELVDLSVTLAEHLPAAWPTHMPFQRKVFNWYARKEGQVQPIHSLRGPYQTGWLTLDEHCGTHFDAPTHFIPPPDSGLPHAGPAGTVTVEQISLDRLIGPAAVIDIPDDLPGSAPGVSPVITA